MRWKLATAALGTVVGAVCTTTIFTLTAAATPTPVQVDVIGRHPIGTQRHEGTFTATAPFCRSGSFADVVGTRAAWTRKFTCEDGSGTITIHVSDPFQEHVEGGTSNWTVRQGTGSFTALRGTGTYRTHVVAPEPGFEAQFTSAWNGVADLDDTAPTATFTRATVERLRQPAGSYLVRLAFGAKDNVVGNVVSWRLLVPTGGSVVSRAGKIGPSGAVSLSVRVRVSKGARALRLQLAVDDVWHNHRTVMKEVRLPR